MCQTLTYIKSCKYDGLLGQGFLQYQANSFSIVCVVLALDSWDYCSAGKAWQPNLLFPVFSPIA